MTVDTAIIPANRRQLIRRFGKIRTRKLEQQGCRRELERVALLEQTSSRGLTGKNLLQLFEHSVLPTPT